MGQGNPQAAATQDCPLGLFDGEELRLIPGLYQVPVGWRKSDGPKLRRRVRELEANSEKSILRSSYFGNSAILLYARGWIYKQ